MENKKRRIVKEGDRIAINIEFKNIITQKWLKNPKFCINICETRCESFKDALKFKTEFEKAIKFVRKNMK
jgi:hypothetical protein